MHYVIDSIFSILIDSVYDSMFGCRNNFSDIFFGAMKEFSDRFKIIITRQNGLMASCLVISQLGETIKQTQLVSLGKAKEDTRSKVSYCFSRKAVFNQNVAFNLWKQKENRFLDRSRSFWYTEVRCLCSVCRCSVYLNFSRCFRNFLLGIQELIVNCPDNYEVSNSIFSSKQQHPSYTHRAFFLLIINKIQSFTI